MPQDDHAPLVPPPAGRLAERYARRMRAFEPARRPGRRDGVPGPAGSTAADAADSLRWARPGRPSVRRTLPS